MMAWSGRAPVEEGSEMAAKNLSAQSLHNVHNPEQKSYYGTAPVYVVRVVLV
jgi:hypothetical protein